MSMDFGFDVISEEEYQRQRALYGPLTESLRRLIEAALHTEVDEDTVSDAKDRIEALTELLESKQRSVTTTLRHEATGRPLAWANPAVGLRNAIAPPMVIHHEDDGQCWSEFTLVRRLRGATRLGARRHLRAGARPPPRRGGQRRADQPKFTGTISLRYLRGTPLGPLRAEAVRRAVRGREDVRPRLFQGRRRRRRSRLKACSSGRRGRVTPDEVLCERGFSRYE